MSAAAEPAVRDADRLHRLFEGSDTKHGTYDPARLRLVGAGLVILGPVLWGFVRMSRGLPPYDSFTVPGQDKLANKPQERQPR